MTIKVKGKEEAIERLRYLLDKVLSDPGSAFYVRSEENMIYIEEYPKVKREAFKLRNQNGK